MLIALKNGNWRLLLKKMKYFYGHENSHWLIYITIHAYGIIKWKFSEKYRLFINIIIPSFGIRHSAFDDISFLVIQVIILHQNYDILNSVLQCSLYICRFIRMIRLYKMSNNLFSFCHSNVRLRQQKSTCCSYTLIHIHINLVQFDLKCIRFGAVYPKWFTVHHTMRIRFVHDRRSQTLL